ncbi:T9SS type A sorting domain-containing protein [Candidatus Amoebophilus asiaticus]|nr:T9SS type A sorting domain-containing protein [Candidatus Amoebophilus asiaticus]
MKKQSVYVSIMTFALLIISYQNVITFTGGPPAGKTGAPGDVTCISSSCHSGTVNTGSGTPIITIVGGDTTYLDSQTYTITVSITQTSITKFGFQIVVLDATNSNAGTVTITDATNTKTVALSGKTYVEHTSAGSTSNSWSFDWKSPSTDVGAITFYAALNAANGDLTAANDDIYTTSLSINPDPTLSVFTRYDRENPKFNVYPNPASEYIHFNYSESINGGTLYLTDLAGRQIQNWQIQSIAGIHDFRLALNNDTQPGIYVLHLRTEDQIRSQKVLIK